MNNDLETLFQTSFRPENTTQAEDWNVPSDRVWGGIEADLKKKKRRKILLFTLLPCAFAAMGLALYFATKQPINHKNIASSAVKNNVESSVNKVVESPSLPMPDKSTAQTNIVTSGQENGKILIAEGRKSAALDIKKQSSQPKNAARNFISSSSVLERSSEGEIKNNSTIQEIATQNGIIATNLVTLLTENPVTTAIAAEDKLSIINETKALLLLAKLETRGFSPIYSQSEQVSQPQNIPASNFLISTLKSKYASNALIFMAQPFLFKNRISSKDNIDFSGEKVSYAYNVGLGLQRTFPQKNFFGSLVFNTRKSITTWITA
jgi:hypothetical protein